MTTENLNPCIIKTESDSRSNKEFRLNLPFGAILKTEVLYEHVENGTPLEGNNESLVKSEIIYFNNNGETASVEGNNLLLREDQDITDIKLEESNIKCELKSSCDISDSSWREPVNESALTNSFKCPECDFHTIKSIYLDKHCLKHTNPNKFSCTVCDYHTHRKDSLDMHVLRHNSDTDIQTYKCNLCEFETVYSYSLRRHFILHGESEDSSKYSCNECNYKTTFKHNLVPHIQRHNEHSGRSIPLNKQRLRLRVCGEKCPQCDYQTCDKSNLNRHILGHAKPVGKRSYTCHHCGLQVTRKDNLVHHIFRRHMPKQAEVLYKCKAKDCDFAAASKGELRLHSMRHKVNMSGSAVYICEICSFQTNYKMSLTRHLLLHKEIHEVEMYCCFMCDYKSVRKDELKSHIKRHSKNAGKDCR